MRFLTDRVVPAVAVLAAGVILALVARAVVTRLLTRLLPGDDAGVRKQVKGAARGVMWFLIAVAVIVAASLNSFAPDVAALVTRHAGTRRGTDEPHPHDIG